jgi:hypothetical protein
MFLMKHLIKVFVVVIVISFATMVSLVAKDGDDQMGLS